MPGIRGWWGALLTNYDASLLIFSREDSSRGRRSPATDLPTRAIRERLPSRPSLAAAATKGAARFPRDLATDLKVAEKHGFLSDKGTVTLAPNERALVSCLLSRLQQDDPDVLVGHNILGFELDVLLGRALHLKLGNAWSKVGRLKRNKPPSRWKAASGRDTFHASATCGRLICDTYLAARPGARRAVRALDWPGKTAHRKNGAPRGLAAVGVRWCVGLCIAKLSNKHHSDR